MDERGKAGTGRRRVRAYLSPLSHLLLPHANRAKASDLRRYYTSFPLKMMMETKMTARSALHSFFQVRKSGIQAARSDPYSPAVDPPLAPAETRRRRDRVSAGCGCAGGEEERERETRH